ncbi:VOC family protein [Ketobacter sp. MCCC 1A13808]|uniref:VOC family protein n=1 Tax=Ketobacter sp. MCCC 1A13808 TaxID=2602738 RepID=UPI0012EBF52A|nr:VOC family protein [Ketobacter sp. MCCC 1A13808]MVF12021.1 VOC family protein [Ketobacter sp. MCCC 1A13808]
MFSSTLTHIALHVTQIGASVDFYRRYCNMHIIHQRNEGEIVWLAEPGREKEFIFVLMAGGKKQQHPEQDYSHLGFAVQSKADVDRIAQQAESDGLLIWPPREDPFPVGYFCGVKDPSGNYIEFSYGQPLGPGAEEFQALPKHA